MNGNGPAGNIVAVVKKVKDLAYVKGYCANTKIELPLKSNGKIDVSGAVGRDGFLNVLYETGGKQGYKGVIPIVSGEIAEDFTNYFATSQQTPNVVALGVLVNKDGVVASGGYKIELMPDATNEDITKLEEAVKNAPSISSLIEQKKSLNEIVEIITGDSNSMVLAKDLRIEYKCDCSKEKFFQGLKTLGKKELDDIFEKQNELEVVCHFCGKKYYYSKEELIKLKESK
jgi:molecular chaperone Hsp33